MIKTFRIDIQGNAGSYKHGSEVKGIIVLSLTKEVKCRGLKLKFSGIETTEFTEGSCLGCFICSVSSFQSSHRYFDIVIDILKLNDSEEQFINLPAGNSCYPFSVTFPAKNRRNGNIGLPQSLDSSNAKIEYTIKAVIEFDKWWKKSWKTKKKVLSFLPDIVPLSSMLGVYQKIEEKRVPGTHSGYVKVEWNMPRRIINTQTSDTVLRVKGSISNQSSKPIHNIETSIIRNVRLLAKGHEKFEKSVMFIDKKTYAGVSVGQRESLSFQFDLDFSKYKESLNSKYVWINYEIDLNLKVSGVIGLMKFTVPVFIYNLEDNNPSSFSREELQDAPPAYTISDIQYSLGAILYPDSLPAYSILG